MRLSADELERRITEFQVVVGKDDKVVMRSISVLDRWNEFLVVSGGVASGDRIVIEGQLKARPGQPVQISSAEPAKTPPAGPSGTGS